MSPRRLLPLLVCGALVLGACAAPRPDAATPSTPPPTPSATPPAAAPTPVETPAPAPPPVTPRTVVDGLDAPWSLAVIGSSVLVSERDTGRILEVVGDGAVREVGRIEGVVHGGEGGLLGLASDRALGLYVYSTGVDGNRVERYPLRGLHGQYTLGPPRLIIGGLPAWRTHNGGRLAFGPDDKLYVAVGDASDEPAAQDLGRLNGKILRLNPDGTVPADNPWPGSPVYSLGHRNVQGLAWAADGTLFASEFGQNRRDELNRIEPGGNYGWPVVEGTGGASRGFIDPLQTWSTDAASPSGIAVVGSTILIANLRGRVLRAVPVADPSRSERSAEGYGRIRDVATGPDGTVWILTNNTDGRGDPRPGDDRIVSLPAPPA